ncbi:MAG: aspartate aminotransferase family protein [Saprospiraceae bacterium]|jgi:acetylornithine/N-succinyldiaminopimelate aminotransferase|nr:aspartate aminotransferase family protein [Saprospiraceae bacterium]
MFSKRQLFLQHVAQTSDFPMCLEVSHASGMYIYGTDGKKYLDFDSGISVSSVGHCHPAVVNAVKMQAETYMHTMVYGEHIQAPQVEYATLLSEVLNNGLNSVYYVNSGSEAVETAIKLARKARGRYEIISCANAYHGSTIAAESLRSDTAFTKHFVPTMPGVRHIRFNNETDLAKITNNTACVILEPVQAEAGIIVPENDYLQKVRTRCQQTGTLMILDEIQTGFGRTGEMFAHQKYGITPDILLIAKGMGGGMPIGGVVASTDLMMHFARNPALGHITTFGGHPVCVAAALATIKLLLHESHIAEIAKKEVLLKSLLKHDMIKEVRSSGLMMAVEIRDPSLLTPLIDRVISDGVLIDYFLFNASSFRIAPPLIITDQEIEYGVRTILNAMDAILR